MTTKQSLLAQLELHKGSVLSGEALAPALCVSRTAIWKAVKDLQKAGYPIDAVPHAGYTLSQNSDTLSAEAIRPLLHWHGGDVIVESCMDSTNTRAKQLAAAGAPHGTLVVANEQTAGRGRRGRSFHSPAGSGLYLSMILRNSLPMESAALVTSAAAVAVCHAVQSVCGLALQIKWVNDLYKDGKKCCGILTEASADFETGGVDYVVVGIGVNVREPAGGFPADIEKIATALYAQEANVPRSRLAAAIANEVFALANTLPDTAFMAEYRTRNLIPGRDIFVLQNGTKRAAHALNITDSGHLLVEFAGGDTEEISFGEVSIRLQSSYTGEKP
ncbi:MAG: biotin--[acetyl-CoA-carboxylase] ligase [Ruthenibacterium sp.]